MQRFNLVLLPTDANLQVLFSRISQSYFGDSQDGYMLADEALAHVTLCQFRAENERAAIDAFLSFADKQNALLAIQQFRIRTGTDEHNGFLWAEYLVERKQTLLEMQKKCHSHLMSRGHQVLTSVESYSPHITLARVPHLQDNVPSIEEIPDKDSIAFRPAVGVSTENGILTQEL
jgi:2'-5' RNA ligase